MTIKIQSMNIIDPYILFASLYNNNSGARNAVLAFWVEKKYVFDNDGKRKQNEQFFWCWIGYMYKTLITLSF